MARELSRQSLEVLGADINILLLTSLIHIWKIDKQYEKIEEHGVVQAKRHFFFSSNFEKNALLSTLIKALSDKEHAPLLKRIWRELADTPGGSGFSFCVPDPISTCAYFQHLAKYESIVSAFDFMRPIVSNEYVGFQPKQIQTSSFSFCWAFLVLSHREKCDIFYAQAISTAVRKYPGSIYRFSNWESPSLLQRTKPGSGKQRTLFPDEHAKFMKDFEMWYAWLSKRNKESQTQRQPEEQPTTLSPAGANLH